MKHFFKTVTIETVVLVLVGLFPFLAWWTDYSREFILAFSLSLANATAGYLIAVHYFREKTATFNKYVYGAMLVRMAFIIGFALYMIKNEYVQMVPFFISLMFFYILHQWTEISSWLKVLPGQRNGLSV